MHDIGEENVDMSEESGEVRFDRFNDLYCEALRRK